MRERKAYSTPFRQPFLGEVQSQAGPNQPIVVGSTLVIRGQGLSSELIQVRIGGNDPVSSIALSPMVLSDTEITVPLTEPPLPANSLRAGVQGVQVVQPLLLGSPPTRHRGIDSNVAAFVLHPTVIPPVITSNIVTPSGPQVTVTVKLKPDVGKEQRVVLLLNEIGNDAPVGYSFSAPPRANSSDSITIPIHGVKAADYLVRVQIDGAESPLTANATGRYESPKVTIL